VGARCCAGIDVVTNIKIETGRVLSINFGYEKFFSPILQENGNIRRCTGLSFHHTNMDFSTNMFDMFFWHSQCSQQSGY